MSASFAEGKKIPTDVHRATACGEIPAQRSFRSRNCSRSGSLRCAHCCNPGRERGCARNQLGAHRQGDDSECPSGQNKCQDRQYTRDDCRRQRLSRGETKTQHYLPNKHVGQAEVNPHTFRPDMIRVAHASDVRMKSLECFLKSRERCT